MNGFPSKEVVDSVKRRFPPGTRVELISMDDPYGKLNPGDRATVTELTTLPPCIAPGTAGVLSVLHTVKIDSES